jgi:hypothetical protein
MSHAQLSHKGTPYDAREFRKLTGLDQPALNQWVEYKEVIDAFYNFIINYAPYFYYLPESRAVDATWGRGPAPAAHAIEFLNLAYNTKRFEANKTDIKNKIVALADYLVSIQCTDPTKKAYGGFQSKDGSTSYYSIDAMRAIPALLKAYDLTTTTSYLDAAILAGNTFLYNMQHDPYNSGLVDAYYGGFAQYVTIDGAYLTRMYVLDLYGLIALKTLKTYDPTNATKYQTMIDDMLSFYRTHFESLWLYYNPKPSGDNLWHREGIPETNIYDDDYGYALYGLYWYEGYSLTVKTVYTSIQNIGSSIDYPSYDPSVCWSGYVNVVHKKPASDYYDSVTMGLLYPIRRVYDTSSLKSSFNKLILNTDAFKYWGVKFIDLSPEEMKQATVTVAWLGTFLIDYTEKITQAYTQLRHAGVEYDAREIRLLTSTDVVRVASGSVGLLPGDNRIGRVRLLGYYNAGTPEVLARVDQDGDLKIGSGTKRIGSVGIIGSVNVRTIKSGSIGILGSVNIRTIKSGSVGILGSVNIRTVKSGSFGVLGSVNVRTILSGSVGIIGQLYSPVQLWNRNHIGPGSTLNSSVIHIGSFRTKTYGILMEGRSGSVTYRMGFIGSASPDMQVFQGPVRTGPGSLSVLTFQDACRYTRVGVTCSGAGPGTLSGWHGRLAS